MKDQDNFLEFLMNENVNDVLPRALRRYLRDAENMYDFYDEDQMCKIFTLINFSSYISTIVCSR